jgi:hypothetical protein
LNADLRKGNDCTNKAAILLVFDNLLLLQVQLAAPDGCRACHRPVGCCGNRHAWLQHQRQAKGQQAYLKLLLYVRASLPRIEAFRQACLAFLALL